MKSATTVDEAIRNVADSINKKRRQELIDIYNNSDIFKELNRIKASNEFTKGSKSKVWRKVATIPVEVDLFFQKIYGEEYYKEKDFFTKFHPEWLVVDKTKL